MVSWTTFGFCTGAVDRNLCGPEGGQAAAGLKIEKLGKEGGGVCVCRQKEAESHQGTGRRKGSNPCLRATAAAGSFNVMK
ncbi:hypothetical protein IMZ48_44355 [Candidatus Bathyarchaeota archaeon]|nr:hypothetical protein [Candidatus Bathyarchaeota archaeon]